jgi:hypothetical protein
MKIRARDKRGGEVNTSVTVEIFAVNDAPNLLAPVYWTFEEPEPSIDHNILGCKEDEPLNFTLIGEDPIEPEDVLTYHLFSEEWDSFLFENDTGEFSYIPSNKDVGNHAITFGVSDGTDMASLDILIKVKNVNDDPMIITDALPFVLEDMEYSFFMEAFDEDPTEDKLTWSLDMEGELLFMDDRTGEISGLAGNDEVGAHEVEITVTDEHGGMDSRTYTLIVNNTNDAPHVERTPSTLFMEEDSTYFFSIGEWFSDIDDEVLSYSVGPIDHMTVELLENNTIMIAPEANWSGLGTLEVTGSDGIANVTDSFQIVVEQVNDAPYEPMFILDAGMAEEGETVTATGFAVDVDRVYGDELTYAWFSNRTGRIGVGEIISFTLSAGHHMITMTATDEAGEFVQYGMDLIITPKPVNETPDDDDDGTDGKEKSSSNILVIVILIPILILVLLGTVLLILFMRKRKGSDESETEGEIHEGNGGT